MAVALVYRGVGREAVHVPVAVDIPDPDPLPSGEHHIERLIVRRSITVFQSNIILSIHNR